jgi:hypothetical protein
MCTPEILVDMHRASVQQFNDEQREWTALDAKENSILAEIDVAESTCPVDDKEISRLWERLQANRVKSHVLFNAAKADLMARTLELHVQLGELVKKHEIDSVGLSAEIAALTHPEYLCMLYTVNLG